MGVAKYAKALIEDAPLHLRLTALAISLVLSTAVIIGAVQYGLNTSAQLQREGERLQAELRLAERYIQDVVGAARQKVAMLAATPPIQGLIRAERADGVDPFDGSSEQLWKDRLAQIFDGFARHDRDLLQVRYIQAADDGKELVRVERKGDQVVRVPEDQLQSKSDQPYVSATLEERPGAIKVFDISLNREKGAIQNPHVPVLRVSTPVYATDGRVYGLVILNFDFRAILRQLQDLFSRMDDFYLTSHTGDFLLHSDATATFGFDLGHHYRIQDQHPASAALFSGDELTKSLRERGAKGEMIGELRKLSFDPENRDRFFLAAAFASADDILAASFASRSAIFVIVALLVAFNAVLASYLARYIVRPLKTLTEAANSLRNGTKVHELSIPTERGDEVGELAKSFRAMAMALEQRQEELSRSNKDLSRSNSELRDFAYIASHDLREPIRAAASHASMLLDVYKDELDQDVVDRLSRICALCERMAHLTSTLLDYSRIDAPTAIDQVDAAALIEEISSDLAEVIAERNAEIVVQEGLPMAAGNTAQLRIVFQNLITNGLKYNNSEKPRIEIGGAEHGTSEAPDGVRFWVRDNGVGIDPDQQHHVFRIFKRLHRADAFGEGTGVGLTFVKRVVEALGGEIWLESAVGLGTTFHFTNPGAARKREMKKAA